MPKLHLDSEYRNRWEEFHLADGTIEDSRLKNWREVAWDQVVKITAHLRGSVYEVDNLGSGFKAFMNFRWAGMEAIYDENKKYIGHKKIDSWVIGWTDGVICFQKNIDFKTGFLIEECKSPIQEFIGHIHPLVYDKVFGGSISQSDLIRDLKEKEDKARDTFVSKRTF